MRLDDASIWAQVLNHTARLAIEVTALDLPLGRPLRPKTGNEPALVVLSPDSGIAYRCACCRLFLKVSIGSKRNQKIG